MQNDTNQCSFSTAGWPERLLAQKEVAAIIGVSQKTLEYWRWHGGGPAFIKVGRLVRYRLCDINAYVEQLAKISRNKEIGE